MGAREDTEVAATEADREATEAEATKILISCLLLYINSTKSAFCHDYRLLCSILTSKIIVNFYHSSAAVISSIAKHLRFYLTELNTCLFCPSTISSTISDDIKPVPVLSLHCNFNV